MTESENPEPRERQQPHREPGPFRRMFDGTARFWLPDLIEAVLLACLFGWMISQASATQDGASPKALARGAALYDQRCYFCHGYSGDARTLASSMLSSRPRDLSSLDRNPETLARVLAALENGVPGTGMVSFSKLLTPSERGDLAFFVTERIAGSKTPRPGYHTPENGWPDHGRHASSFPFATGALDPSADPSSLTPELLAGRDRFLSSCVTCHDRTGGTVAWGIAGRR